MKVFVTGAQGALGTSVAQKFIQAGHSVIGSYQGGAKPAVSGIEWIQADLGDADSVKAAGASLASVDAWIHCAGGFRWAKADEVSVEDVDFLLSSNLKSALLLVKEILPGMKKRNFGRIVFVSSRATIQPPGAGMGAYAASKAGLNLLTEALADETRSFDINVNAVLPSIIDTPANRKDMPGAKFSDWVSTDQLAEVIFSLTQPWGKPIHGALIPVSGRV